MKAGDLRYGDTVWWPSLLWATVVGFGQRTDPATGLMREPGYVILHGYFGHRLVLSQDDTIDDAIVGRTPQRQEYSDRLNRLIAHAVALEHNRGRETAREMFESAAKCFLDPQE